MCREREEIMLYEIFLRLYAEGKEYDNEELYIGDRGWQEWMEQYTDEEVADLLNLIYRVAKMGMREMRGGLTRMEFCQKYRIPFSSVRNWENGVREAPEYVQSMIAYVLFNDLWIRRNCVKEVEEVKKVREGI